MRRRVARRWSCVSSARKRSGTNAPAPSSGITPETEPLSPKPDRLPLWVEASLRAGPRPHPVEPAREIAVLGIDRLADTAPELEYELEAAGKHELLELVRSVKPDDMECIYIRQAKALGLGHAVLCAECVVVNEPFAVLLADDLMMGEPPIMKQMVEQFNEWRASIIAVQEVPAEHTRRYGIVAGTSVADRMMDINRIVEKPAPEAAPSRLGVAGRYILTPDIFTEIRNQPRGVLAEVFFAASSSVHSLACIRRSPSARAARCASRM